MLGIDELKESMETTRRKVECPVKECEVKVAKRKGQPKRKRRYRCREHNIYISPSTFEYEYSIDNLLWHSAEDLDCLGKVEEIKRGSDVARDNSEDAAAWNVLRFLDKADLMAPVMNRLIGSRLEHPEVIYWSYCHREGSSWSELERARREFGVQAKKSPQPEAIINSPQAIVFVVAKLTSDNATKSPKKKPVKKYMKGGRHWFPRVFSTDYRQVAVEDRKYELMLFWLLGTWMAARRNKDFHLVTVVREGQEEDIEEIFGKHISQDRARRFARITWEDIYRQVLKSEEAGSEKERMIDYFRGKTLGYGRKGLLHKAFHT